MKKLKDPFSTTSRSSSALNYPHLFIAISLPMPRCSPGKLGSRSPNPLS